MTRPILAAAGLLLVPLLCAGCSGSSAPATQASPTVSATPDPNFYVTNGYVVTEPSAGRDELNKQLPVFAALPGVKGAGVSGAHQVRVDVQFAITRAQRDAVIAKMRLYGTVAGVPIVPGG